MSKGRLRRPAAEHDELVDKCLDSRQGNFVVREKPIDDVRVHLDFNGAGIQLIDRNGVCAVVLYIYSKLGALDPESCVFCDENGAVTVVGEVQTRCQDAVVGRCGVENRRKPRRLRSVQLDAQRPTLRQGCSVSQSAGL